MDDNKCVICEATHRDTYLTNKGRICTKCFDGFINEWEERNREFDKNWKKKKQSDYCLFYIDNAGCRFKITPSRWNIKNIRNRLEVKENGMV